MIASYILIIGAMKSGTTTLFDALAQHPEIAPCIPKEPGFFAFEEVWAQGFEWYETHFDFDSDLHRFALDGSTDYTKRPFCNGVADRLAASAPRDFRLIYIMRDPLRRIESHARHTQFTKREVGRFPSPKADHGLDAGLSPVNLAVSRYAYQLEPYRSFYDAGRLHLMTLEGLKSDFHTEMKRVFDFLGLQHDASALRTPHSNKAEEKRQATWLSNRLMHSRYLRFLTQAKRQALASRFKKPIELSGRFDLENTERDGLAAMLRPEIDRLRSEFDFSGGDAWKL